MKPLSLFPTNFSPSMLADIDRCEMYFFRKHCQKLHVKTTNVDLEAGRVFAKACEIVRNKYYFDELPSYEAIEHGQNYIYSCDEIDSEVKSIDRLAINLEYYFNEFPLTDLFIPAKLSDGNYAIEYEFVFDLGIPHPDIPKETIKIKGILDAIYLIGEKYYIVDEKTTKNIFRLPKSHLIDYEKEKNAFRLSTQLICYSWALEQLGIKDSEALIRRVPFLKDYEPAFELAIPITQFMRDNWSIFVYNRIVELIDKYQHYKHSGEIAQNSFNSSYGEGCNKWGYMCPYNSGCIHEEGEEELLSRYEQVITAKDSPPIPLEIKMKELGLI